MVWEGCGVCGTMGTQPPSCMMSSIHIKLRFSAAWSRVTHCCQSREGPITNCISMQSPEAAERGGAQIKSTPRAILEPPGLGQNLAPLVLAPPPPVGRVMGSTPLGSSHMYIETQQLDYPLTLWKTRQPSHQEPHASLPVHRKPPAPHQH